MELLTKEELSALEDFRKIALAIKAIYTNLYQLDLTKQKNSTKYKKYFEYLKICVEEENKTYKQCDFNIMNNIKNYLYIDNNIDEKILIRIINKINQNILYNFNNYDKFFANQEQINMLKEYSDNYMEYLEDNFKETVLKIILLKNQIHVEYLNILYSEANIPKELFQSKYQFSFENPIIEEIFMQNEFSHNHIQLNPCINYLEEKELENINYYQYRHDEVFHEIKELIRYFLKKEEKNKILYFYNQIFFRALLQLIDAYHIDQVIKYYEQYINRSTYKNKYPNNSSKEKFVLELINMYYIDEKNKHLITKEEMKSNEDKILKKLKH